MATTTKTFDAVLKAAFFAGVAAVRPDYDDPTTENEIYAAWVRFREGLRKQ